MGRLAKGFAISKDESGSAILSAMMIVAILALVGLGISSLLSNITNSSSFSDASREFDELGNKVQLILYNDQLCPLALRDATAAVNTISFTGVPVAVDGIYSANLITGAASVLAKSNTPYGSGRLVIKSIDISQVLGSTVNNNDPVQGTTYRSFLTNVAITATAQGKTLSKSIQLKVYANPAAGNRIQRCASVASDNQSCTELGGYFDAVNGKCIMPICDAAHVDVACASPCTPQTYSWVFNSQNTAASQRPLCVCNQNCQTTNGYCPPSTITIYTANGYTIPAHMVGRTRVAASNTGNPLSTITIQCSADGKHIAYKVQPTGRINTGASVSPNSWSYGAYTAPTFNASPARMIPNNAVSFNKFSDYAIGTPAKNMNFTSQYAYGAPYAYYYFSTIGYDGGHQMRFWNVGNPIPAASCPTGYSDTGLGNCCLNGYTYSATGYPHWVSYRCGRSTCRRLAAATAGCYGNPTTNYSAPVAKVQTYTPGFAGPVDVNW